MNATKKETPTALTDEGFDMNTELCISTGKVTLAFGITALMFSLVTAYKVTVFGQPAFFFLGITPEPTVMWSLSDQQAEAPLLDDLLMDAEAPMMAPSASAVAPVRPIPANMVDHVNSLESDARELARILGTL